MDNILKFLEFAAIDPLLYWRITSQEDQVIYEIQWRREARIRWRFRKHGELFWELADDTSIMAELAKKGIEAAYFEQQIRNSLLHQVCFADRIVLDARQLLGDSTIDQALADHRAFIMAIEETVASLKPKAPRLKLLKD